MLGCGPIGLAVIAGSSVAAACIITGRVALEDVAEAFDRLGTSPTDAKILIDASL